LNRIPVEARIAIIITRSSGRESAHSKSQSRLTSAATNEFRNEEIYAFARELEQLHPDNRFLRTATSDNPVKKTGRESASNCKSSASGIYFCTLTAIAGVCLENPNGIVIAGFDAGLFPFMLRLWNQQDGVFWNGSAPLYDCRPVHLLLRSAVTILIGNWMLQSEFQQAR